MALRKTILLIENDVNFLNPCADLLEHEGYRVVPATTIEEAERVITTSQIHLAIVDIRMRDDQDAADKSGLLLASKKEYRHLPKIILTAYPSFEFVREALGPFVEGIPAAVDFIKKDEAYKKLIPTVENAFRERVHINWDLDIHLSSEIRSLPQIVSQIEKNLGAELLGERYAELEDLLRDLFYAYRQISISRLLWRKGDRVALELLAYKQPDAGASQAEGWTEEEYIVTCGLKPEVAGEQENFRVYTPKSFTEIALADNAETFHYAGSAWVFRQADLEECLPLKEFLLREKTDRQVKSSIEKLYKKLTVWQDQGYTAVRIGTLGQLWQELTGTAFDLQRNEWQAWLEDLARDALWRKIASVEISAEQIVCRLTNTAVVSFPNPTRLISAGQELAVEKWIKGITLGGLEADTALVGPEEEAWITDFACMRIAPLYLDFISLETNTRFELLESTNLSSRQQFENQLLAMRTLRDGIASGSVEPDCKRAFNVIQAIRQAAAEIVAEELEPYYWCLLVYTLKDLFTHDHAVRRSKSEIITQLHRVMFSGMIAGKLIASRTARHDEGKKNLSAGIRITRDAYEVIVDGRPVELTPTEYDLLSYLYERAGLLCVREDIIRDVFKVKDPSREAEDRRLTVNMGRLRQKIEIDTSNPIYLQTVRGKGYKLLLPSEPPLS